MQPTWAKQASSVGTRRGICISAVVASVVTRHRHHLPIKSLQTTARLHTIQLCKQGLYVVTPDTGHDMQQNMKNVSPP